MPHTATCSAVIGVVLMVARHANLAGMRHAACGMRKTAHGKAATKRERERAAMGTGSPQETTILRSLLYFTIFLAGLAARTHTGTTHTQAQAHTTQFVLQPAAGQLSWPRVGLLWRSRLTTHLSIAPTPVPATVTTPATISVPPPASSPASLAA